MMRRLLLVTLRRRWFATQHARPPGLSSLLLPLSVLPSYLSISLSLKHSTPHFNHAPEQETLFQLMELPS